jgi:hypothetical protein
VDAGDSAPFSGSFLHLSLFPFGRRSAIRPSATNADRWVLVLEMTVKAVLNPKSKSMEDSPS